MKRQPKKNNKVFKLKTTAFQKVGRIIFWTFFIFLLLRGIGTLFNTDETSKAEDVVKGFEQTISKRSKIEYEASAYAESFAYEFMTYDPYDLSGYRERLSSYLPAYLGDIGPNTDTNTKTAVLSTKAYEFEWISESQINVKVWLKVRYDTNENIEDKAQISTKYKAIGLKVPVAFIDEKYAVEDYPAFISVPDKADINHDIYTAYTAEKREADEIKEVLNSFFKVYYSGSSGEISYYMENSKSIKGLESTFMYNRLGTISVFADNTKDSQMETYTALAEIYITDPDSDLEMKQKYNIRLINDGKRYYISNFDVRTGNLDYLNKNDKIDSDKKEE